MNIRAKKPLELAATALAAALLAFCARATLRRMEAEHGSAAAGA